MHAIEQYLEGEICKLAGLYPLILETASFWSSTAAAVILGPCGLNALEILTQTSWRSQIFLRASSQRLSFAPWSFTAPKCPALTAPVQLSWGSRARAEGGCFWWKEGPFVCSFSEQMLIGIMLKMLKAIIEEQWHFTNLLDCFRKQNKTQHTECFWAARTVGPGSVAFCNCCATALRPWQGNGLCQGCLQASFKPVLMTINPAEVHKEAS